MSRRRKFTKEQEYKIVEEYYDFARDFGFSKLARRWKCSEATIANIYNRVIKEMRGTP